MTITINQIDYVRRSNQEVSHVLVSRVFADARLSADIGATDESRWVRIARRTTRLEGVLSSLVTAFSARLSIFHGREGRRGVGVQGMAKL